MVKETTIEYMGFNEFLITMKDAVKGVMGDRFTVDINHVIKNNSIEMDGLTILCDDEKITPNIYLNNYYERYMEGEKLEELTEEIVEIYKETMEEGEREALCISYELEEMKAFIIFRLVNLNKNRKLLCEIPHVQFLDLAITFHCLVRNSAEGIGTIRITNEHMKSWNTNLEELQMFAYANTPRLFPSQLRSMNEVIKDIFKKEMNGMPQLPWGDENVNQEYTIDQSAENTLQMLIDNMEQRKSEDMYILTNSKGINGATCLLYPEVLQQIAEELNSDFYILPSSIHEVILVIDHGNISKMSLKEMVCDVNQTQVAEDEVLSDQVYYYSRKDKFIVM